MSQGGLCWDKEFYVRCTCNLRANHGTGRYTNEVSKGSFRSFFCPSVYKPEAQMFGVA